jgi:hypothetical protein
MKGLSRMGKQPLKFTFEVYVCDVRGLPSSTGSIVVVWERGAGKASARSSSAQTELVPGSIERCAMVNGKLRTMATLYRSAKRATFDQKLTTFNLIDASTLTVIATTEFDLAEYAELEEAKDLLENILNCFRNKMKSTLIMDEIKVAAMVKKEVSSSSAASAAPVAMSM